MGSIPGGFEGSLSSNVQDNNDMNFGNFTTNSYVYMGGLPSWYTTKLSSLALPSVVFEPRFRGGIRNVVFADDSSGRPRRQEIMAYKVSHDGFLLFYSPIVLQDIMLGLSKFKSYIQVPIYLLNDINTNIKMVSTNSCIIYTMY